MYVTHQLYLFAMEKEEDKLAESFFHVGRQLQEAKLKYFQTMKQSKITEYFV